MDSLLQDFRFALRTLLRRRTFSMVAVITIALGIGAVTSIYSVVDGVLLRPLPFPEAGRLVAVWQTFPPWLKVAELARIWDLVPLSLPDFRDWQAAQTSFDAVGIWSTRRAFLGGPESPEWVQTVQASASMLQVLGIRPELGRFFLPAEDVAGGPPVAVLSHDAWIARFHRDPHVLGSSVLLESVPYTIVGVLPPGVSLGAWLSYRPLDTAEGAPVWTPVGQDSVNAAQRNNHSFRALGRLKAGVSVAQARAETDRLLRGGRDPATVGVRLTSWQLDQAREVRAPLWILLAAAGVLLLVSCVNVATLLLGEAATRAHEMAARVALGAGRLRLARQLLTESLALAAAGAAAGTVLAWWGTRVLVALAPPLIPGLSRVHVDARVLAFALAAALGTGVLFGLAPALVMSRAAPGAVLRSSAGSSARHRGAMPRALVSAQLALSVVLLVGAGLLSRSFAKLTAVNPGFRADHLLVVRVAYPVARARDTTWIREVYRSGIERLAALPGVTAVAAGSVAPFSQTASGTSVEIEGRNDEPGAPPRTVQQRTVTAGYFDAMEIPVLAGRAFRNADGAGAPPVAVISQAEARRDWPGESALGRRLRVYGAWRAVVGIVADVKFRKLRAADEPAVYLPAAQASYEWRTPFLVRTRGDERAAVPAIRAAVHEAAPSVVVVGADAMPDLIRLSYADERYRTMLVSLYGLIAAALAAVGMYGVTSRAVGSRMREMGIRVALGATASSVRRLVVGYTLMGATFGAGMGVAAALAATRVLAPYLFGVSSADPVTYIGILVLLGAVAVAASWIPARRAGRVEPAIILRGE
ncbi:MAG: ABC transporter permease [Gemmatimonadales bacterium]|jgi:predicted permease